MLDFLRDQLLSVFFNFFSMVQTIGYFLKDFFSLLGKIFIYTLTFFSDVVKLLFEITNSQVHLDISLLFQICFLFLISILVKQIINIFAIKNIIIKKLIGSFFIIVFSLVLNNAGSFSDCMKETDNCGEFTKDYSQKTLPAGAKSDANSPEKIFKTQTNSDPVKPLRSVGGDFEKQIKINEQSSRASYSRVQPVEQPQWYTWLNVDVNKLLCCDMENTGERVDHSRSFANFFSWFGTPEPVIIPSSREVVPTLAISSTTELVGVTNPLYNEVKSDTDLTVVDQVKSSPRLVSTVLHGVKPLPLAIVTTLYEGNSVPSDRSVGGSLITYQVQTDAPKFEKVKGEGLLNVLVNPFEPLLKGDSSGFSHNFDGQQDFERLLVVMSHSNNMTDESVMSGIRDYLSSLEKNSLSADADRRYKGSITVEGEIFNFPLDQGKKEKLTQILKSAVKQFGLNSRLDQKWVLFENFSDILPDQYAHLKITLPLSPENERFLLIFVNASLFSGVAFAFASACGTAPLVRATVILGASTAALTGFKEVVDTILVDRYSKPPK